MVEHSLRFCEERRLRADFASNSIASMLRLLQNRGLQARVTESEVGLSKVQGVRFISARGGILRESDIFGIKSTNVLREQMGTKTLLEANCPSRPTKAAI